MRNFWYSFIRFVFNILTYTMLGMKVYGEENIPQKGAVIIACNHVSNFDPLLVGTAVRHRLVRFMAKEELFHNPILRWFLQYVGTFPVHRRRIDRKALMDALRVLNNGNVLGIFPEGTFGPKNKLGVFHKGTALLAVRSGAPIIPAAVIGSRDLPKKKGPLCIVFGKAVVPDTTKTDRQAMEDLTGRIRQIISDLMEKNDRQ